MHSYFCALLAAILNFAHAHASSDHWTYPDLTKGEDFPQWGGICESGRYQSPIDLSNNGALRGIYDKLEFKNYDEKHLGYTIVNNGHTVKINEFTDTLEVSGGPLRSIYKLEQLHFHWWSEHTIDKVRYPLEVHLVHRNKHYENMTEAVAHRDGITVIAILFHASNHENVVIDDILKDVQAIQNSSEIGKPIKSSAKFAIGDLFPYIRGYITYSGSLTTPSCAESVTWIVLTETFPVTIEQINAFKNIESGQDKPLMNNYRNIQSRNQREVIVVSTNGYTHYRHTNNAATKLHFSFGIFTLFTFLSLNNLLT